MARRGIWDSWGARGDNWEVSETYLDRTGGPLLTEWEIHCSGCVYMCMCFHVCMCTALWLRICVNMCLYLECGG